MTDKEQIIEDARQFAESMRDDLIEETNIEEYEKGRGWSS